MAPKKPSVDKLNTYWSKMKPAASRTPSFKAMGLLLECLNSCYKIVKIRGKYERSIPELRLIKSKRQPRKRKVVDPGSTKGTDNPETNPKSTSTKQKEKINLFEDKSIDHEPARDMGYDDQSKGGEKLNGDNLFDDNSTGYDDEHAGYNDHQTEDDEKPTKDDHHVEVEKINERFSKRQRQIHVEYVSSETEIKKKKKKKDQSSTAKPRKFDFEPTSARSPSPIKDQSDQKTLRDFERVEKNSPAKIIPNRVKLMRGWSIMLQSFLLKAPSVSSRCMKDDIKIIYQEKCDYLKEKGEECSPFDDVFHHFVTDYNQHNQLFYIVEERGSVYIVFEEIEREKMKTTTDYVNFFQEIYRERIERNCVHNVDDDGNCGFRAVAKALKMPKGQNDWSLVRVRMLKEMMAHEKLYRKVMGLFKNFEQIKTALTHENGPATKEKWMDLPDMGNLIATTFNVALLVLGRDTHTFLPLRQAPPAEKRIICIGHVNDDHFVEVCFNSEPPLPLAYYKWGQHKYPEAREWESQLESNFELYAKNSKSINNSKNSADLDD